MYTCINKYINVHTTVSHIPDTSQLHVQTCKYMYMYVYWVATLSRLLKIISLFCRRAL